MPYEVNWLIEPRVIGIRLWGELTVDELLATNQAIIDLLDRGVNPVHIISNESKVRRVPIDLKILRQEATFLGHPALGWTVAYSHKMIPFAVFLTVMVTRFYKIRYRRCSSEEEAWTLLREHDSTLAEIATLSPQNPL